MLSERSLQILEKLIDNNRTPITSKTLALYLGVSERSVKTYIKEVSDFCKEQGMTLERKPGIGFVADFSENQIEQVSAMKRDKKNGNVQKTENGLYNVHSFKRMGHLYSVIVFRGIKC